MPTRARVVLPGLRHHITQRGNNREGGFFVDEGRRTYLGLLRELCARHGLRVLGYCLMTNHIHLVATPLHEDALRLAIGRTHFTYTQTINRLHRRTGHLWQGRFHSCPMDDAHAIAAMRYVERNPVRAGMTRVPWTYRWSSAAAHAGGTGVAGLLDVDAWNGLTAGLDWRARSAEGDDAAAVTALRRNTQTGRPLASDSLLSKLEHQVGRRLRPLPPGRPPKDKHTQTNRVRSAK